MPRTPLSPVKAQANATRAALDAQSAAATIVAILNGSDGFPESIRPRMLAESYKLLEASGCSIRRADARGLLLPDAS